MTQFKDDMEALIATIQKGSGADQETKDALASLVKRADDNDATDTEIKDVIKDLATKLANAPASPVVPAA